MLLIKIPLTLLIVSESFLPTRSELGLDETGIHVQNLEAYTNLSEHLPTSIGKSHITGNSSSFTVSDVGWRQIDKLDLRVRRDMFTNEQMDYLYELNRNPTQFQGKLTMSEIHLAMLLGRAHSLTYDDMLMHRYDTYAMLKQSTGPHIDQKVCLQQLEQLNVRLDRMKESKLNSRDLNLYRLLDTFGRISSGLTVGNLVWSGMYEECLNLKIELAEGNTPTRYCLAAIKHKSWPKDNQLSKILAFKAGVCLPRACDPLKYKNKYQLIERLMDFNAREVDQGETFLDNLYCLPDDDSPMQMWWKSPRTMQAVIVFATWFAVLVFATVKYERMTNSARAQAVGSSDRQVKLGLTSGFSLQTGDMKMEPSQNEAPRIYKMLAITHNFHSLFNTKSRGTDESRKNPVDSSTEATTHQPEPLEPRPVIIDLRCLEGIKVVCMSGVITGHVLMCVTSAVSNGRDMASSPAFMLTFTMPVFAVNSFFTITGLLTSYLLFKQNETHSLLTSPLKWASLMMYRYLRIMPIYVIVIYYCKYIGKFTGSGPLWDYGTSSLAPRRLCEEESWLWTILFGTNFRPVLDQCIPAGWYLANDFQFFLVTPFFLAILHKRLAFGQRLLKFYIVVGYLAGVISMLASGATDMRPFASFMSHGFKTYATFFTSTYTRPYYRIPAYLCGLLFGHQLYVYEQKILKYRESAARNGSDSQGLKKPEWSEWFLKRGAQISLLSMLMCAIMPIAGAQIPLNKFFANLLAAMIMPLYNILFALSVGFYILLATTGHGNKFLNRCLSASFWKPLARLSLCAVLVNMEVVNYIIQSHKQLVYVDFLSQWALNLLAIVATYLVAIVVFVSFEAPIKAPLNQLLSRVIASLVSKQKVQ